MDDGGSHLTDIIEVRPLGIPLYGRERFFFGAKPDSCIAYLIPLGGIFSQKGSGIVLQVGSQSAFVQVQEPGLFLLTRHTSSSSSVFDPSRNLILTRIHGNLKHED